MGEDGHDLVRVDGTGTAHPVGKVASQRMRARQGSFRLMPSPGHLVVMRKASGESGAIAADSALKLCGEITSVSALCDIVSMIGQSSWSGELAVFDGTRNRSIFFESGTLIGAQSSAEGERLGEVLYRYGALSLAQVQDVARAVTGDVRFGETAVRKGFLTREKLFHVMARQVEEIVYAVMRAESGMFYFLDRFDPARVAVRHSLSVSGILMEAARRMDEMSYFRERIPSAEHVPDRVPERAPPAGSELMRVFDAIDGVRTISDVCRVVGQGEFEVTRQIFQLVQSGCVCVRAPRPTGPFAIVALFNQAMKMVLREIDQVARGAEIRQQLASFATGAGIYDALFMRAGPKVDGTLDEDRIVENIAMLVGPEQAEASLAQWLYDYVSFAIFIAEPILREAANRGGASSTAGLAKNVADIIAPLSPGH